MLQVIYYINYLYKEH